MLHNDVGGADNSYKSARNIFLAAGVVGIGTTTAEYSLLRAILKLSNYFDFYSSYKALYTARLNIVNAIPVAWYIESHQIQTWILDNFLSFCGRNAIPVAQYTVISIGICEWVANN